jgi:predicted esterase
MAPQEPEIVVTLVHGTWGRGLFPRTNRRLPKPELRRWFEPESKFRKQLEERLAGGVRYAIEVFCWSGANSIRERERATQELNQLLLAQQARHPGARLLVIGHSHGGNVALKAGYLTEQAGGKLDIVTIATPFLQIAERGASWQAAIVFLIATLMVSGGIILAETWLARQFGNWVVLPTILIFAGALSTLPWLWTERAQAARQRLLNAAELIPLRRARMLVVRGYADEAGLALSIGTAGSQLINRILSLPAIPVRIVASLTGRAWFRLISEWPFAWSPSIRAAGGCGMLLFWGGCLLIVGLIVSAMSHMPNVMGVLTGDRRAILSWVVPPAAMLALLVLGGLALTVNGRELFRYCLTFMVTVDSVPDARGDAAVVTLKFTQDGGGLRHSLYEDEYCAYVIACWIRDGAIHLPGGMYNWDT